MKERERERESWEPPGSYIHHVEVLPQVGNIGTYRNITLPPREKKGKWLCHSLLSFPFLSHFTRRTCPRSLVLAYPISISEDSHELFEGIS